MLESDFLIEFFLAVPFPSLFGSLTGIVGNKILGILCQHQPRGSCNFPWGLLLNKPFYCSGVGVEVLEVFWEELFLHFFWPFCFAKQKKYCFAFFPAQLMLLANRLTSHLLTKHLVSFSTSSELPELLSLLPIF